MKIAFLHALPFDGRMWAPQLEAFADHETHAPTLYGFGSSFDEWALGVLQEVPGRFVAVGASMGGYTGCAIARLAPERLEGLVLVGSRADADPLTSNAVWVFSPSPPTVQVGDRVDVKGKAQEFFNMTEVAAVTAVFRTSTGNALPTAVTWNQNVPSLATPFICSVQPWAASAGYSLLKV